MRCSTLCARSALLRIPRIRPRQSNEEANPDDSCSEQPLFLDLPLQRFASDFLVLLNNFVLNHLPRFVVKRVNKVRDGASRSGCGQTVSGTKLRVKSLPLYFDVLNALGERWT